MASKGAILCLFLVSAVLSSQKNGPLFHMTQKQLMTSAVTTSHIHKGVAFPTKEFFQVNGTPADSESAVAKDKRGCGPASPFSVTIGAPPILGGLQPLLKGKMMMLKPLLLGPLLPLLGPLLPLLAPLMLLKPLLLGPLLPLLPLLGPLLPLLLGPLLPLLLGPLLLGPLLLGPLNPLKWLKGDGAGLRNLIFHKIYRLFHGWTKPAYLDGLSAGNRVPLKNQWGQKYGIFPLLGYPVSWRLFNQWGSPTKIINQI